jgi:hypothetical protein
MLYCAGKGIDVQRKVPDGRCFLMCVSTMFSKRNVINGDHACSNVIREWIWSFPDGRNCRFGSMTQGVARKLALPWADIFCAFSARILVRSFGAVRDWSMRASVLLSLVGLRRSLAGMRLLLILGRLPRWLLGRTFSTVALVLGVVMLVEDDAWGRTSVVAGSVGVRFQSGVPSCHRPTGSTEKDSQELVPPRNSILRWSPCDRANLFKSHGDLCHLFNFSPDLC